MSDEVPGWGQVLQSEVGRLREVLSGHIQENRTTHKDLWGGVDDLKNLMNTRLPIWTTFLIGGLMSLSTGLAVALLR